MQQGSRSAQQVMSQPSSRAARVAFIAERRMCFIHVQDGHCRYPPDVVHEKHET
jgi:hypothetical protein